MDPSDIFEDESPEDIEAFEEQEREEDEIAEAMHELHQDIIYGKPEAPDNGLCDDCQHDPPKKAVCDSCDGCDDCCECV